ncbi:MAG: CHAT domain-containing protein [Alphaproteobacteria bacterium]|nr:CHAT domain-containing protein [Alphaproteobacteria bacterium]
MRCASSLVTAALAIVLLWPASARASADELEDLSARQALAALEADVRQAIRDRSATNAELVPRLRRIVAERDRLGLADEAIMSHWLGTTGGYELDIGRPGAGEALFRRALESIEHHLSGRERDTRRGFALFGLAEALRRQGRYGEAARAGWESLALGEATLGKEHPRLARVLDVLGLILMADERPREAEPLFKRAYRLMADDPNRNDRDAPEAARILVSQLEALAETALRIGKAAVISAAVRQVIVELAPAPRETSRLNAVLARSLRAEGKHLEAYNASNAALFDAKKVWPADSVAVARLEREAAVAAIAAGNLGDAFYLLARAAESLEKRLGKDDLSYAEVLVDSVEYWLAKGDAKQAASYMNWAATALRTRAQKLAGAATDDDRVKRRKLRAVAGRLVELLSTLPGGGGYIGHVVMFHVAQIAHAAEAGQAIAQMADRIAAGDGRLAAILRERQEALARLRVVEIGLARVAAGDGMGSQAALALRQELDALAQRVPEVDRMVAEEFPSYAGLSDVAPVEWTEIGKLLRPGEAMLFYMIGERRSGLWVFTGGKGSIGFRALPMGRDYLALRVAALRRGLRAGTATRPEDLPAFDLATAAQLYRALVDQAQGMLDGVRHLVIVPDGPLTSLPFELLVADDPPPGDGFARLRAVNWLGRDMAISVVPSVSSLKALRAAAGASRAPQPFLGVGDPLLDGHPAGARSGAGEPKAEAQLDWQFQPEAPPSQLAMLFRGGALADVRAVRGMAPLPDTAVELRELARRAGAGIDALWLRERASERAVRAPGALKGYRVLAFATHGLAAGELRGAAEPALVLSPPDQASDDDDGLLTASEIARLDLDADWVILSACNTAAPDGTPGSQGLSGLAKAFFHAGSRALLASHWPVFSDAAVQLTTGMLGALAADPAIGRAEAARRARVARIEDKARPHYAHPIFWAPFSLVGDGGR